MDRRDFLKISGAASLGAVLSGSAKAQSAGGQTPGNVALRENPVNGDKVSLLGFGCMRWPMIKDDKGKDIIDQEAVNEMVDYALAHGINYFDTSPVYLQGQSEKAAGEALSRHPRNSYFIATKLSNFWSQSKENSIKMYENSFKEMKTDYFDYYLLHSVGRGGDHAFRQRYVENGMMDFLMAEKAKGRIRNIGFSFHGSKEAFDEFMQMYDSGEFKWDFVQIEMNYVDWKHADGKRNCNADYLYAELDKRGIPVIIMEPLLGGQLADVPMGISRQMKMREPDKSAASWAFRFCGTYPGVLCVLSGMTNMDPLIENVKTFSDFKPLTAEELAFMERMAVQMKEYPLVKCTGCNYCMPCPWGIDIPGIFRHYNSNITAGTYAQGPEQKNYRKLRNAYLTSYNKAIPTLRQADHCIGCGSCLSHCPQSIDIPKELNRIDHYIERLKRGI